MQQAAKPKGLLKQPDTRPTAKDARLASELIRQEGSVVAAARVAGISRQALTAIGARADVRAGSLAIFRTRVESSPQSEPPAAA